MKALMASLFALSVTAGAQAADWGNQNSTDQSNRNWDRSGSSWERSGTNLQDRDQNQQQSRFYQQDSRMTSDQATAQGQEGTKDHAATQNDRQLLVIIRDKIKDGWFTKGYDAVVIDVNNGNVTLLGTVKSAGDKDKVEKEVRKVEGVRNVNNQITVQERGSLNDRSSDSRYDNSSYSTTQKNDWNDNRNTHDTWGQKSSDQSSYSTTQRSSNDPYNRSNDQSSYSTTQRSSNDPYNRSNDQSNYSTTQKSQDAYNHKTDTSTYSTNSSGSDLNKYQSEFPQDKFATNRDLQLNKKIRDKISVGWFWNSYETIKLNTNNGVVTLEGTVKNPEDQQKLVNEIKKVDGVKSVVIRLQTQKDAQ